MDGNGKLSYFILKSRKETHKIGFQIAEGNYALTQNEFKNTKKSKRENNYRKKTFFAKYRWHTFVSWVNKGDNL